MRIHPFSLLLLLMVPVGALAQTAPLGARATVPICNRAVFVIAQANASDLLRSARRMTADINREGTIYAQMTPAEKLEYRPQQKEVAQMAETSLPVLKARLKADEATMNAAASGPPIVCGTLDDAKVTKGACPVCPKSGS